MTITLSRKANESQNYKYIKSDTSNSINQPLYQNKPQVSIIIPLYNEEKSIGKVLGEIPNHGTYEIVIVDDGSTDNSLKKISDLNREDIHICKHKKNRGYGAAILTGLFNSHGDIVVTLDSDGQHNPNDIGKMISPIQKGLADIVIGSRYLGKCLYDVPLHTRTGEYFISIILKLLFGFSIRNNQSGFRAFRRNIAHIFKSMKYEGMGFTTEVLFKSGMHNLRILEVPIEVSPRQYGLSYVNILKVAQSIFKCILSFFIRSFSQSLKENIYVILNKFLRVP